MRLRNLIPVVFAAMALLGAAITPAVRADISQSDMQGLPQLLERLWNPNCAADPVIVPVRFSVGDDGHLISRPTVLGGADPVAARRAIDAVRQAEPFAAPYRGKGFITVIFDAKKYCASR